MFIRDILSLKGSTIFSIAADGKVSDAVNMMVANDIGSLVVMEGGRMTGMLTFREVLKALDAQRGNLGALQVGSVMARDPICGSCCGAIQRMRAQCAGRRARMRCCGARRLPKPRTGSPSTMAS